MTMRGIKLKAAPFGAAGQRATGPRAKAAAAFQLGVTASRRDDWAEAQRAFDKACRLYDKDALYWANLAQAHRKLGRYDECVAAARKANALAPDLEIAHRLLAAGLKSQHQYGEAVGALREVAESQQSAPARYQLAYALMQSGDTMGAVREFMRALTQQPDYFPAHVQLGNLFKSLRMHREAMECFLTAAALQPGNAAAMSAAAYEALHACEWTRFAELRTQLAARVQESDRSLPVPFMFLSMSDSRADQRKVAATYAREHCRAARLPPLARDPARAGRPPRIGYISNDLRNHPVAVNIVEVLELHDPAAVELFVYSYGPDDGSTWRRRIEAAAGPRFADVRHLSDAAIADRIRADGIELLIDLTGFTTDSRTAVLSARPAPVQAAYLGYPGTSGSEFIDYLICDAEIAPLAHAADYSEKLAHLPVTYQPNDRKRTLLEAPSRAQCELPDDAFVFCSLNNVYKFTPELFARWCRLLRQVERSVLWLFEANPQARAALQAHAAAHGIDAARLVFAPPVPSEQHLARLRNADLFLDTLPYNAHTTGGEVLWAGVPLLTCPGESFAARVAGSLVKAAGVPELAAASLDEYEAIALRLATHPDELAALRARLWAARETCALFDSRRITRDLEALYGRMVGRWRDDLGPDHLPAG
jgi:predicted O-linked N-acetylglucosamine transferase (SPINDLY family)